MNASVIFNYLKAMNDHGASDLYLTVGVPPTIRKNDHLEHIDDKPMTTDDVNAIINAILTTRQRRDYDATLEFNTSLDMGFHGRFRINVLRQRQSPALVIRRVIIKIPTFNELKLPSILEKLSLEKRGFVLLSGMSGSGKTTTLASMIDYRNTQMEGHIITIEDPIEYFHNHKKSVVTQREVGVDTESYALALKNALRQRPDVIMVGEIRDREVMEQALISSETGHLCLATLHANNAYQAIERIVNLFPEDYSRQIRLNLSTNLKAIISQRLLPSKDGTLVPAVEVMLNQGLVRELILSGNIIKIRDVMEQSASIGMQTFDQALIRMYQEDVITEDVAIAQADREVDIKIKLQNKKISGKKSKPGDAVHGIDTSRIYLKD